MQHHPKPGLEAQRLWPCRERREHWPLVLIHAAMASGITVTSNLDPAQLQSQGVTSWPTWSCGGSTFPWTYYEQETCMLLEGDVTITPEVGNRCDSGPVIWWCLTPG